MNKTTKWYAGPLYVIMALALVAGLTLVPTVVPTLAPVAGPIVEASSVSNVTVRMGNTTPACDSNCTINFTTTVNLTTTTTDTITIEFPNFTGAPTGNNTTVSGITADGTWVNGTVASSVTTGGRRVSITPSVNVTAGNVTVVFGNTTANITNPDPEGNYTVTVYTSKEPTPVTSAVYVIDSMILVGTVVVANTSVNVLSAYTIPITTTTALVANTDTITIIFPGTTTVPTSINAGANITVDGTALASAINYTGNNTTKTVTIDVPAAQAADELCNITFTQGALLKNPITINTSYWRIWAYTSKDRGPNQSALYSTTSANQSEITQLNWNGTDPYIPNNTASGAFNISTLDVNGAYANVTAATTIVLDAADGSFYSDSACTSAIGTINIAEDHHNTTQFYYKCSSPGTQNVSARDLNGSWTRTNTSIIVNPMIQLWGGGVITGNYTTFANALTAALPYDTIKVLPSTYKETFIVWKPHLTIESTGGKANTSIIGKITLGHWAVAHNLTIGGAPGKGFSFSCNNTTEESILLSYGSSYSRDFHVSYCTFNTSNSMNRSFGIAVLSQALVDVTVTENDFIVGDYKDKAFVTSYNCEVSNFTVTNNTFTGVGSSLEHIAIKFSNFSIATYPTNITGNTMTNIGTGIYIGDPVSGGGVCGLVCDASSAQLNISDNTFDNCNRGVDMVNAFADGNGSTTCDQNVVIKRNTFVNNTYGITINHSGTGTITNDDYWNVSRWTVQYNNFNSSNVWPYAIYNAAVMPNNVPSTLCWWGNASGPGGQGPGGGCNVTTYVTYSPWLDAAYPGGNTTYESNITLQLNWNFISVPKRLSNATFGFLLSGQNISASYSYDPGTGWTLLNNSSPVAVLAGYWVDANAAGIINLTYVVTGQEVPASKDLTGNKWNAIGFSNLTADTAENTLQSINGSWSTVLGWNATGQEYDGSIIWPGTSPTMAPSKGYWVWMTANDTLSALSA